MYRFGGATKKRVLITLLSTILMTTGCGKETPQEHISNAQQAIAKHDNKAAIIELKNALQQEPNNAEARALLGSAYVDFGDALSAEKELRQASKLGGKKENILPALGQSLLMQGKFKEVLDEIPLDTSLEAEKTSKVLTLRGNAHMALGQPDQAKTSFDQALLKSPANADAYLGLASLAVTAKDMPEAFRQIDLALQKDPKKTTAMQFKGDLYRYQGKNDQALEIYRKIVGIDSRNIPARLAAASLLIETGKLDDAREEVETAYSIAKKNLRVKFTKALLDFRQKRYNSSHDELLDILKVSPDHIQTLALTGMVELALGSDEQSETRFNRVLALDPKNMFAKKRLAALLLKRNKIDEGMQKLNALLAESPNDPEIFALLGSATMAKRQYTKASEYFEKAAELAPRSAAVRTELAVSRLASGKTKEGMADLEAATKMESSLFQADVLLITNNLKFREFDKALTVAAAAEKKQPKNPVFLNLKGGAYLGKKDIPSARKSFEQAMALDPVFMPAAVNLAKLDLMEKKPDQARKRFEAVLNKDGKNMQAMLALAELAQTEKKPAEAIEWLEKAVASHPDAVQPRTMLVGAYVQNKQPQKAVQAAKDALSANPASPLALELLGGAQLANKQTDEAIATFTKMTETAPDSALPYLKLAGAYIQKQNLISAKNSLTKALQLKPDYFEADIALFQMAAMQKQNDEALRIARQLQQKYPKSPAGFVFEGDVLIVQNKPLLAAKSYEIALGRTNDAQFAIKAAAAYARGGQALKGEGVLLQRLRVKPSDITIRNYLGTVYMAQNKHQEAVTQYQAVLKLAPNHTMALNNMAWVLLQLKNPQAVTYAQKAYKLEPENASIIDTLGWIYLNDNQIAQGLDLYKKAVKLSPGVPEIQYHYAVGLHKSGDKVAARVQLKSALDSGKTFPGIEEARVLLKQL